MPKRTRRVYTPKISVTVYCPVSGCQVVEAASASTESAARRRAEGYLAGHIDHAHKAVA